MDNRYMSVVITLLNSIEKELCSGDCINCRKKYPVDKGDCLSDLCGKLRYQIRVRNIS